MRENIVFCRWFRVFFSLHYQILPNFPLKFRRLMSEKSYFGIVCTHSTIGSSLRSYNYMILSGHRRIEQFSSTSFLSLDNPTRLTRSRRAQIVFAVQRASTLQVGFLERRRPFLFFSLSARASLFFSLPPESKCAQNFSPVKIAPLWVMMVVIPLSTMTALLRSAWMKMERTNVF